MRSKFWNLRIIVPIHKKYCWFCNKFPNIFVINPLKWHFITFPIIFQPKCWQFVLCQWIIVGVNPSLLLYQMSLINEHNIYICPLILAFYRKTLTLRLFVLILQFNVSAHCQISASTFHIANPNELPNIGFNVPYSNFWWIAKYWLQRSI